MSLAKRVGAIVAGVLTVTLAIMFGVLRSTEESHSYAKIGDQIEQQKELLVKSITFAMGQGVTDVAPFVATMSKGKNVRDLRILPSRVIKAGGEVEKGKKLADRAGASLQEIVGVSQKVTDMVTQRAAASEQQSSASEQISKNVEGISKVTGETAQGTQQIARAAEDLNRLTDRLQQLSADSQSRTEWHCQARTPRRSRGANNVS